MKILVADDDRSIGLALQMALEDLGHECVVAEDGRAAWTLFQQEGADTIISDWRMPGLQGPELCRLVRAEHTGPYVYFVLLTVLDEPRHVLEGMQAGADDYLTKPFTIDSLQARLIAAERVTALHRNLTERHAESLQAAEERGRLLHLIEQERSQLETVIRQMPAGVVIVAAPSGEIVMVNDRIAEIWREPGLSPSNVKALRNSVSHLDGRPYEPHEWPLARVLASGEIVTGEEIAIARHDGSTGTVRVSAAPIYDGQAIVAVVVVVDDVTEARQRQQEATQSAKLRALGQLAGGVAHDLNQSLTLVAGYADVALTTLDDGPRSLDELREMLRIVARAAYDGGETVKRLLTFSRGRPDDTTESFEVATLLDEVAQLTAPRWRDAAQAQGRPITLTVEAAPAILLEGWAAGIREALINLILNAVDEMPTGGRVTVTFRSENGEVVTEVADSGRGIAPEIIERFNAELAKVGLQLPPQGIRASG